MNKVIIISSPSGAGKTTLCKYLLKKMKNVDLSISYTTRPKRVTEKHKKDYFFIKKNDFIELKQKKYFIESAKVFNNYYGSPYKNIDQAFKNNKHILFDIDWQGARKLRKHYKKEQIIDFFILPPNKKELKKRLKKRGRESSKEINIRLSHAIQEMSHHNEYQYVLINDKIIETVNNLLDLIKYNLLKSNLQYKIQKKLKIFK